MTKSVPNVWARRHAINRQNIHSVRCWCLCRRMMDESITINKKWWWCWWSVSVCMSDSFRIHLQHRFIQREKKKIPNFVSINKRNVSRYWSCVRKTQKNDAIRNRHRFCADDIAANAVVVLSSIPIAIESRAHSEYWILRLRIGTHLQ